MPIPPALGACPGLLICRAGSTSRDGPSARISQRRPAPRGSVMEDLLLLILKEAQNAKLQPLRKAAQDACGESDASRTIARHRGCRGQGVSAGGEAGAGCFCPRERCVCVFRELE